MSLDKFANMHQLFDGMHLGKYYLVKVLLFCKINETG
jgi:hypothetical protein